MSEPLSESDTITQELITLEVSLDKWSSHAPRVIRCAVAEISRLRFLKDAAEDALRSLASCLGAGGYNADTVDAATFEAKVREGVDSIIRVEVERATDAAREEVARLTATNRQLAERIAELEAVNHGLAERIAAQAEVLRANAERKGE